MLATATSPLHATTYWEFNVAADLTGTATTYDLVNFYPPDLQVTTDPWNEFVNFEIFVPAFDTTQGFVSGGKNVPPCDTLGMSQCGIFGTLRFDNRSIFIDSMTFWGTSQPSGCDVFIDCYPYTIFESG